MVEPAATVRLAGLKILPLDMVMVGPPVPVVVPLPPLPELQAAASHTKERRAKARDMFPPASDEANECEAKPSGRFGTEQRGPVGFLSVWKIRDTIDVA